MDKLNETIEAYFAMWNEHDEKRRAELIERAWADGAHYVDPKLEAAGPEAISKMVAQVHTAYPGHRFRRLSGVDRHHDLVRFAWDLADEKGVALVAGVDVAELAADGRLRRVAGFFGELPAR